jgi:hypothetical protein
MKGILNYRIYKENLLLFCEYYFVYVYMYSCV